MGPEQAASVDALKHAVRGLAADLPVEMRSRENQVSIVLSGSPVTMIYEVVDDQHFAVFFYCRTSSWNWVGERTDLHDVASVLFASALRALSGVSCRFANVLNPSIDVPSEIYGRYIIPIQPPLNAVPIARLSERVGSLFDAALQAQELLHSSGVFAHGTEGQDFAFTSDDLSLWKAEVLRGLDAEEAIAERSVFYKRTQPTWRYFHSEDLSLSLIESPTVSEAVRRLCAKDRASTTEVPSVDGRLLLRSGVSTVISYASEAGIHSILGGIESATSPAFAEPLGSHFLALEDHLIVATGNHVLAMEDETGLMASQVEQARLLERHSREAELLFSATTYEWQHPLDPGKFEDLVVELLEREAGVMLVRKSGSTYDRDAGQDMIIERIVSRVPVHSTLGEQESPWERLRIVGQCKTTRDGRTVGTNKIQNILDTVEAHGAGGYLLAVSSELTGSAVQRLNTFRERGTHHVEWWTPIEIEQRLRRNPDIAARYAQLIAPVGLVPE
jgi:hypothetical protein